MHDLRAVNACDPLEYELPKAGPLTDPSPPGPHLVATFAGMEAWAVGLKYETPITLRFTSFIDSIMWNCVATYSPDWKDALTKEDTLIDIPSSTTNEYEQTIDLHTSDSRLMCIVNAWLTVVEEWAPDSLDPLLNYTDTFQYYLPKPRGFEPDVDECFFDNPNDEIEKKMCLQNLAQQNCYAPSTVGKIVGRQVTEYGRNDGWNMYGTLNNDGTPCTTNCRPFTDPTGYKPRASTAKKRWQPLLEDDGRGYFTRQEHVTPHIGTLGTPLVLSREEMDSRGLPNPMYTYKAESRKVMERMSSLDDEKKMKIEFFDDKVKVALTLIGTVVFTGASFEQVLNYVVGVGAGDFDAMLLAWKEKVKHDLVRPTTFIQNRMGDKTIKTWAGPFSEKSSTKFKGKNFEAYTRVMPHSEYVSGSACICQAAYEFTDMWLDKMMGMPNSTQIALPMFPAGSSTVEPGMTPASDLDPIIMENLLEFRNACGESRLDGGMHFSKSVPDAYQLCEGVGVAAVMKSFDLWGMPMDA